MASARLSDANANWSFGARPRQRPAPNFALSILWPIREWASRACFMSFANASARTAPSSYREAVRPTVEQTPFLPFIEVVRGSFRISAGEAENDIAQKLETGLTALGLHSSRNLGLLLHLLGLKVPDGALTGLDGVLIGLRTRELLQQLLEARCRISPVVMVIEDLHWIDSVSEELLGKIVDSEAKLRLLLLTTRRPEYAPPWLDRAVVTKLLLEPLPMGDIRRLIRARLGVEALPEPLAWQVAEKAEGNPLFAEEIVSFLSERGIVRTATGKLDFDATVLATALPTSVQSLLTARVDRLAPNDRTLLQAASVIGRRFDPQLLAAAIGETDVDARLGAMQTLDLVHPRVSRATTPSSTRWCATRSIRAC